MPGKKAGGSKALPIVILVVVIGAGAGYYLMQQKPSEEAAPGGGLEILDVSWPTGEIVQGAAWGVYVTARAPEAGIYTVTVQVGEQSYQVDLEVKTPGENTYYLQLPGIASAGTYSCKVGGFTGEVKVREPLPAKFVVATLSVSPKEAPTNKPVKVIAVIRNEGEMDNTYEGTVQVRGNDTVTKSFIPVTIKAGTEKELTLTLTESELEKVLGGAESVRATVSLGDASTELILRKPKPPKLEYLSIQAPALMYTEEEYKIQILVKNSGDMKGSLTLSATISVGGEVKANPSRTMTLDAGEEYTWTLTYTTSAEEEGKQLKITAGTGEEQISCTSNIVAKPPVTVESLTIPNVAMIGETVEIVLVLKNNTTSSQSASFQLLAKGPEEKTISISESFGPNERKEVTKEMKVTKEGIYTISVADKSATLKVLTPLERYVPGETQVYKTDYLYEIPLINFRVERHFYSRYVYLGTREYEGTPCMVWVSEDAENPEAWYQLLYQTFEKGAERWWAYTVAMVAHEEVQDTVTRLSPPGKNFAWPVTEFTGDWVKYEITTKARYMGQEYVLKISGEGRFTVKVGEETAYITAWGEQEIVRKIEIITEIRNAKIDVAGMTGTVSKGVITMTRYWAKNNISLRDESETKIDYVVGGIGGSLVLKMTSEMVCYQDYWKRTPDNPYGRGGNPNYYYLLPTPEW